MSINSFNYFIREGFKNIWVNRIMSAASMLVMVCCMILTGGAVLFSYNVNHALKSIENRNSITVFLNKEVTPSQALYVGSKIEKVDNVIGCEYYSSGQAAEKYKDVLGSLYEAVCEEDNPFPESFHVTMNDLSLYQSTVDKIKEIPEVDSIGDRSETAQKLSNLSKTIAKGGIAVVCSLGLVSLFIISNTIRISMHSRRFEISIMKSVGATNAFIRSPFIVEGLIIGIISAALSSVILKIICSQALLLISSIIPLDGSLFDVMLKKIFGYFFISGSILGIFSSIISIKKYLKQEGGMAVAW